MNIMWFVVKVHQSKSFNYQGAQDSDIREIPGMVMGFFIHQSIPGRPGNVMRFLYQGL